MNPPPETFILPTWPSKLNAAPLWRRLRKNRTDNNHAYEELRELIVEPEQEGIAEIQDRLENLEKRTRTSAPSSPKRFRCAAKRAIRSSRRRALAPTIQETLRESVRRDPQVLADALFPVMGPAIRKSISRNSAFNAGIIQSSTRA